MLKFACTTAAVIAVIGTVALAEGTTQRTIPANSYTVTDWYKQSVYDPKDAKIGEIMDVLVDKSGKVTSLSLASVDFLVQARRTFRSPSTPCGSRPRTTTNGTSS